MPSLIDEEWNIDIAIIVPIVYMGEIVGSFLMVCLMIGTLNSTNILFSSETDGSCANKLGTETYVLSGLILVKTILSAIVCVALTS